MSLSLSILNDPKRETSQQHFEKFQAESVLPRLKALCVRARQGKLDELDAKAEPLIQLGMELDADGRVTKNSYGVFDLSWQVPEHPEWAAQIQEEVDAARKKLEEAHGSKLRFLIWAGMGGSVEDKTTYFEAGLLKGGPRVYSLDSTDPAKLKAIIQDMQHRSGLLLPDVLRSTLVVGMAMGMTSYEPVMNLEKLSALFAKNGVESGTNFLYMTLPGSILDEFAGPKGYTRVALQADNDNTTAGRHSAPLTRGSLYPLALAGVDLRKWMDAAVLSDEEIGTAWKLAAFLHAQGETGHDKVTLLLPKSWTSAALWTKQDVEESLGKSEAVGIKVVIREKVRLRHYRKPLDGAQDRVFLAVQLKGEPNQEADSISSLRHARYPIAILTFPSQSMLSAYMQFMHYVVFGIAYLRQMNFVTQPGVELYKTIAAEVYAEAKEKGGTNKTAAWEALTAHRKRWKGCVSFGTPTDYANAIKELIPRRQVEYAELTFFGDLRYTDEGKAIRKLLDRAADLVFRSRLQMPVDIYEGPAMNHSYHEMIIGHGKCLSTVILSEKQAHFAAAAYEPDYHVAQFLATRMALERKGRHAIALVIKDLSEESLATLAEFFAEAAEQL